MSTASDHPEELDLAIPDMDSAAAELAVKSTLEQLRGIHAVRLLERGAFIRYDAQTITKDEVCHAIRQAGYRASVFQDSKSGQTGTSSQ